MLSHANLYANAMQGVLWFKDTRPGEERTLAALPFFHVFAMTTVLLFGVYAGAEIIMLPRWDLRAGRPHDRARKPTYLPRRSHPVQRHRELPRQGRPDQHPFLHQRRRAAAAGG